MRTVVLEIVGEETTTTTTTESNNNVDSIGHVDGDGCGGGAIGTQNNDGGNITVTYEQFSNAVYSNGYPPPTREQYEAFMDGLPTGSINTQREAAMILAQLIHESGGLRLREEIACKDNPSACHYDLGMGDQLMREPWRVSSDEKMSWAVSFSYWKRVVHNEPGVQNGHFGSSTKAINGRMECGTGSDVPKLRFEIYKIVHQAFGLQGNPDPTGC